MVSKSRPIYWTRLTRVQVNYDIMTFGDTLCGGSSFGKFTILMEHLSLKFMLKISVLLLQVMF